MALEHRADHIVRTARARSGNRDFDRNRGVPQRDFVQYLNDAQARIYNLILQTRSSLYQKQAYASTTANSPFVPLPSSDVYLSHNLVTVMYSHNGNPINYAPLDLRTVRQEVSVAGYPDSYFLLEDQIVLSPYPSSGTLNAIKMTYQKVIPNLDVRRALVSAHGLSSITLTDDATLIRETEDDLSQGWVDYISVVDRDGVQLATSIPVTSYNSTTRIISCTLTAAQNAAITNGSSYVVFGKNTTTNSQLPDICERYLTEYTVLRAQMGNGNRESMDTSPVLQAIEKEIVDAIEELEEDIFMIPILDRSMMNYADDF